jgi:hypothetical protein
VDKVCKRRRRFRTALRWCNDFPEAWVGLAAAVEVLGRDEDALAALRNAITLRSDYVGALLKAVSPAQPKRIWASLCYFHGVGPAGLEPATKGL